jgi:hypothetical protein
MRLPVALELLELLATVNIPKADRRVIRPTDELPRIRGVEMDAVDRTAVMVSNVSFTGKADRVIMIKNNLHLSPADMPTARERGRRSPKLC